MKNAIELRLIQIDALCEGLYNEKAHIEQKLKLHHNEAMDLLKNNFVVMPVNEKFDDHMVEVEYSEYYQSVEEAYKDGTKIYSDAVAVYNLLGEKQTKLDEISK